MNYEIGDIVYVDRDSESVEGFVLGKDGEVELYMVRMPSIGVDSWISVRNLNRFSPYERLKIIEEHLGLD